MQSKLQLLNYTTKFTRIAWQAGGIHCVHRAMHSIRALYYAECLADSWWPLISDERINTCAVYMLSNYAVAKAGAYSTIHSMPYLSLKHPK